MSAYYELLFPNFSLSAGMMRKMGELRKVDAGFDHWGVIGGRMEFCRVRAREGWFLTGHESVLSGNRGVWNFFSNGTGYQFHVSIMRERKYPHVQPTNILYEFFFFLGQADKIRFFRIFSGWRVFLA